MLPRTQIRTPAIAAAVMGCIWLCLFFRFATPYPFDWDSVNFAFAITDCFNPAAQWPQPPGYFFHVVFGQILHRAVYNAFIVAQIQNLVYLGMIAVSMVIIRVAPAMILFVLGLPLFLYFSITPVVYAALAGWAALVALQIPGILNRKGSPVCLVITYALSIGFRQDLSLFLLPVILYTLWKYRPSQRQWIISLAAFCAITLAWLVPTWIAAGKSPFTLSAGMFFTFAKGSSALVGATVMESMRCSVRALMYFPGAIGPGGIIILAIMIFRASARDRIILALAVLPSILFTVFIHGPKPGYFGLTAGFIAVWLAGITPVPRARLLIVCLIANVLFFAAAPRPVWTEDEGFRKRPLYGSIIKQIRYTGACGLPQVLAVRAAMKRADERYRLCPCIYAKMNDVTEQWILSFWAKHMWHIPFHREAVPGCCEGAVFSE